jgi:hypothetical protein
MKKVSHGGPKRIEEEKKKVKNPPQSSVCLPLFSLPPETRLPQMEFGNEEMFMLRCPICLPPKKKLVGFLSRLLFF